MELDGIVKQPAISNPDESELIRKLLEYTDDVHNPFRQDYLHITVAECLNFKELRQWDSQDVQSLLLSDTPALPIDRINRNLDNIRGIYRNTSNRKRVTKGERGDDRIANILDKVYDRVSYDGNFSDVREEAFDSMLDTGIGLRKVGYDSQKDEIWCALANVEDCGWSKTRKRDFSDLRFIWQHLTMDWQDAIMLNPSKAGQLKSLKAIMEDEWNKLKNQNVKGSLGYNYQSSILKTEVSYQYADQVHIWEIWLKKTVPTQIISYNQQIPLLGADGNPFIHNGQVVNIPSPAIRSESLDYQLQEGEQLHNVVSNDEWWQYVIAAGADQKNGILLKSGKSDISDCCFSPTVAEFKKNGAPRGFIEIALPHQKRINIAWAQKVSYNNHAIKSPLIVSGEIDLETAIQSSKIGTILVLPTGTVVNTNNPLQANIQAIEEGGMARQDMDFAAAASEPALMGQAAQGASGLRLSLQQNAAITPVSKWVNAEGFGELVFARKVLALIIKYFPPEKLAKIVGEDFFYSTLGYMMMNGQLIPTGTIDKLTGQVVAPPVPLPLSLDVEHYDITIEDSSVSDFNKQQTFNGIEALVAGGVPLDDTFRIKNAPIKAVDEALASNEKAKTDIIRQLEQEIQMLEAQLQATQKMVPKESGTPPTLIRTGQHSTNQRTNAQIGANQNQSGQRSMIGGALFAGH